MSKSTDLGLEPPGPAPVDGHEWVGRPLLRREDDRLVTGRGRYVDDLESSGQAHVAMLRSPYAHARILSIDTREADAMPGVIATITGTEAAELTAPLPALIATPTPIRDYCLALSKARFVGEPVAAVAAVDRATAEDALERIAVEYEPLDAAAGLEAAMASAAPLLYEELGTNVLWHDTLTYGDVKGAFASADGVIRERYEIQRYASTPLETFGCICEYDSGMDSYTFWTNDQRLGLTMTILAQSLRVPQTRIRLITPDIGGGFGNKRRPAYLLVCALLARKALRPVRWIEDRIENLTALAEACNGQMDVEIGYRADGTVLGLRVRDLADEGKNLVSPTQHNLLKLGNIANGYRIPAIEYEGYSVLTNKCPTGANRGIGKPFMCFGIERTMTLLARRLGLDPVDLRLRNYVQPDEMPYTTPTGAQYDSGDYPATLRALTERMEYRMWRDRQRAGRADGHLIGIGIATSVEPAGSNLAAYELVTGRRAASGSGEGAHIRMEGDGQVHVTFGDPPSGQGYETTVSQIVADALALTPDDVHVQRGIDTATTPWMYLSGNYSNKFSVTDIGAILGAAERLREKLLRIASHQLGVAATDLNTSRGRVIVRDTPSRMLTYRELARTAYRDPLALPPGEEPGLEVRYFHQHPLAAPVDDLRRVRGQLIYSNAAHGCVVEIDPGTALVKILKYVVAHDCGKEVNPLIVEGMVHGSTAHGIGAALLEALRYDEQGQFLSPSFMHYLKPTTLDMPEIEVIRLEHPSPYTPLGTKGVGEGGAIASPAAVANAVEDALTPYGTVIRSLPITPDRVWRWLERKTA